MSHIFEQYIVRDRTMYGCLTLVLVANEKEYETLVAFTNDLQANRCWIFLYVYLIKQHALKTQGAFLTLALVGSWCLLSLPSRFVSREDPQRVPWLNGSERWSGRRSEQNHNHRERPWSGSG